MLSNTQAKTKTPIATRAAEVISADRALFGQPNAARRRAKAWLDEQIKKGQAGPFAVHGKLYPELAALLLENNAMNRKISDIHVHRLMSDMKRGAWLANGETIIVSAEGQLNDGQHRCRANIDAGVSIDATFCFGVARSTRTSIDQGLAKTPANYLEMEGVKHAKGIAHACRLLILYRGIGRITSAPEYQPTKGQIIQTLSENLGLISSAEKVGNRSRGGVTNGLLIFCHFIFSELDSVAADRFVEDLMKGINLREDDPVYALRERVALDRQMKRSREPVTAELMIRAWNMRRKKKTATKMQIGETFPIAI